MKANGHIPLRFIHSNRGSFTLTIVKKAINPHLFPFSSKKIAQKGLQDERGRFRS
ncbi:MAG TPA: hypothetical protein VFA77_07995 [Candidatus Eisenbacteria bacterium]|nr:hypothetical protein [Candidatus Eisenbacteria bacterium]